MEFLGFLFELLVWGESHEKLFYETIILKHFYIKILFEVHFEIKSLNLLLNYLLAKGRIEAQKLTLHYLRY
jgi:hypothetical protein